jgi:hypothetical protein
MTLEVNLLAGLGSAQVLDFADEYFAWRFLVLAEGW